MERRSFVKMLGAASLAAPAILTSRKASAQDKVTIALIPGLTADGFYVTMHHGAEAAAKAVGAELIYQGAAEWNVHLHFSLPDGSGYLFPSLARRVTCHAFPRRRLKSFPPRPLAADGG